MKVPKHVSLKTLAVTVLIAVLASGFIFYVLAPTPSATFYVSPGAYPGAPSYTVFEDGGNYFSKNEYGEIEFADSNASQVLQDTVDVLAAASYGGSIYIQGLVDLDYTVTLDASIKLYGDSCEGFGSMPRLSTNEDIPIIIVNDTTTEGFLIEGLTFIDATASRTTPVLRLVNPAIFQLRNLYFQRASALGEDTATAIQIIVDSSGAGTNFNTVENIHIVSAYYYGIKFDISDYWFNGNTFTDLSIGSCRYAIYVNITDGGVFNNNQFTNVKIQSAYTANVMSEYGFWMNGSGNTLVNCKVWDVDDGNWSMRIVSGAVATELIACRFLHFWDEGTQTVEITALGTDSESYVRISMVHPTTTNWDGNMTGVLFFDTTHGRLEFWNGTHLFYLDSTIHP